MAIDQRYNKELFSPVVGQSTSPDKPLKQGYNFRLQVRCVRLRLSVYPCNIKLYCFEQPSHFSYVAHPFEGHPS